MGRETGNGVGKIALISSTDLCQLQIQREDKWLPLQLSEFLKMPKILLYDILRDFTIHGFVGCSMRCVVHHTVLK